MHFCLVVVVARRPSFRRRLLQIREEGEEEAVVGVHPTHPGEGEAVAAAAEEVRHRLCSVEEGGEGEGVRVVWSVDAVGGEGEEVWGSSVPWTEGEVVGAVCSAEVEVQESTYSAVAAECETVVGVTQSGQEEVPRV